MTSVPNCLTLGGVTMTMRIVFVAQVNRGVASDTRDPQFFRKRQHDLAKYFKGMLLPTL